MSFYFLEATAFAVLFVREPGTKGFLQHMAEVEDNQKLISAITPLEIHAALRRREQAGSISATDAEAALEALGREAVRIVQLPLNPAVFDQARKLLDRKPLRWPSALQLASVLVAREIFHGADLVFVSSSSALLEAAREEGFSTLNPADEEEQSQAGR